MSTGDTSSIAAIRDRIVQLEARLGAPDAAARLEPLKAEIAALYRAVDEEIQSLTAARGEVKGLVERWKRVRDGAPSTPRGDTRALTRADHLGASTFVERGWSLLSTGDAVGAEAALRRALELSPGD